MSAQIPRQSEPDAWRFFRCPNGHEWGLRGVADEPLKCPACWLAGQSEEFSGPLESVQVTTAHRVFERDGEVVIEPPISDARGDRMGEG